MTFALVSDEKHVTADHYGIPVRHWNPRAQVYPYGYIQPAVFAYVGEREAFGWIQRPRWWNLLGAAWRPEPTKVLAALRRAVGR